MIRKTHVRRIRFGIRFKFSIIMIIGISFASTLIGLAVYNQHENKIKDTILRLSGTLLKGTADNAQVYLRNKHILYSRKADDLNDRSKKYIIEEMIKARDEMSDYFSTIVRKEEILDIAYLIDVNWKDIDVSWDRRDQASYHYFNRINGKMFELSLYSRGGGIIKDTAGRDDAQLKPTIFSYFMQNINTSSYLTFSDSRNEEGKQFVIVGMPLFNDKKDIQLYENYLDFKKTYLMSGEIIKKYKKRQEQFKNIFTTRLIEHGINLEYDLIIDSKKKGDRIYAFLFNLLDQRGLNNSKRNELRKDLYSMVNNSIEETRLPLFRIKIILNTVMKGHNVSIKKQIKNEDLWQSFYDYITRRNIKVTSSYTVDDLALMSFRKDLAGVLGLFLLRDAFYTEMLENRKELLNLILSILLRAIVVALFFPTFIIRSVSTLEEGAMEIGRGNLEKRIELKGSDELGRLADIINVMTSNLKMAQKEMLVKQRMQEELKTAQEIQSALLPETFPVYSGIDFGAYYMAQTESGGDYYDFIKLDDNKMGIAMGDVSGHGVGSGLVMAITRTLLHTHCRSIESTKRLFEIINEYLYKNTASNYFVTMFYGILDLKTLSMKFSSAGHNPGIILRKNKIIEIPAGGIALGATSNDTMARLTQNQTVQLQKGDYFIQYTDGVDESMNSSNKEFGLERFFNALLKHNGKHPQDMIHGVIQAVDAFTGKVPQHDDITLIAIRIK